MTVDKWQSKDYKVGLPGSKCFILCTIRKYLLFKVGFGIFYNILSVKSNSVGQYVKHIPGEALSLTEVKEGKSFGKIHIFTNTIIFYNYKFLSYLCVWFTFYSGTTIGIYFQSFVSN